MTPPGSTASVLLGNRGVTSAEPGSVAGLVLAVEDITAATSEAHAPGPDPQRRSYASYASFSDPDGNRWLLQELTERLPGRV